MASFAQKYLIGAGTLLFSFVNFVACGSQLYQVSVRDDLDVSRVQQANPQYNDPESTLYGIHASSGWGSLPISFKLGTDMDYNQKQELLAAMQKWEWATGKSLFEFQGTHSDTKGDSFKDLFSSLGDAVNGHYIDADWNKTSKPTYVLATTIWNNTNSYSQIATADIRFNSQHYVIGDSLLVESEADKQVVDMQSLAIHELGHLLGLAHVDEEIDPVSVMNPSLFIGEGLTSRKLSRSDIVRIQTIYGCEGDACDIDALIEQQEHAEAGELSLTAKQWLDYGEKTPISH
jgi:hypothetical protein